MSSADVRTTAGAWLFIVLWSLAFVPSKISVQFAPPFWLLGYRFLAAGVICFAIALYIKNAFPKNALEWRAAIALGVCSNAIYLGCTYLAVTRMSSGLASIIAALNPVIVAALSFWFLQEPMKINKIVGIALGFGGVIAIATIRHGTVTALPQDVALALVGVAGSAAGTIIFKRYCAGANLVGVTTVQLLTAAAFCLLIAAITEVTPHITWTWSLVSSFLYLTLIMSVAATFLWFWLVRRGQVSKISAYFFLTPVFGSLFAALLLHESIALRDVACIATIAAGVALVQRG